MVRGCVSTGSSSKSALSQPSFAPLLLYSGPLASGCVAFGWQILSPPRSGRSVCWLLVANADCKFVLHVLCVRVAQNDNDDRQLVR